MNLMKQSLFPLMGGLLASVLGIQQAQAAIALDRTRVVFNGGDKSTSLSVSNENKQLPYLAQGWVEDAQGNKITTPLTVLPPLQRLSRGQKVRSRYRPYRPQTCWRKIVRRCSISTCVRSRQRVRSPTRCSWHCRHASNCFIGQKR